MTQETIMIQSKEKWQTLQEDALHPHQLKGRKQIIVNLSHSGLFQNQNPQKPFIPQNSSSHIQQRKHLQTPLLKILLMIIILAIKIKLYLLNQIFILTFNPIAPLINPFRIPSYSITIQEISQLTITSITIEEQAHNQQCFHFTLQFFLNCFLGLYSYINVFLKIILCIFKSKNFNKNHSFDTMSF